MQLDRKRVYSGETVRNLVKRDANALGWKAVVAFKVGTKLTSDGNWDYHFAVLLEDGQWADKLGPSQDARYGQIDPAAEKWDLGSLRLEGIEVYDPNYYDSITYYVAIEK